MCGLPMCSKSCTSNNRAWVLFFSRFRAGSAGVYVGAKDVHILDMSGSFFLATNRSDGKTENGKTGNMRLRLEGASLQ